VPTIRKALTKKQLFKYYFSLIFHDGKKGGIKGAGGREEKVLHYHRD
jgi:hypothetical protein